MVSLTKREKIVNAIIESIREKHLLVGDPLPSVNEMSQNLNYARETVVKAYKILKDRGLVTSKRGLGYFVSNDKVDNKLNIALVLYGFQAFQQEFYNTFRKTLGDDYQIDVFFHHNNYDMYRSIMKNIKHRYGMYVVAPIQSEKALSALSKLPKDKLLIIDRYQFLGDEVSSISQEFEISLSLVFEELEKSIKQYERIVLYYRDDTDYPEGIYTAFLKFCREHQMEPEVYKEYEKAHLVKNSFYFTLGDSDLWRLLKDAKQRDLKIGSDLGILSHNDSPVKEIIEGGITTFSTDFNTMAVKAANSIIHSKKLKEIIPCLLIKRNSL